MNWRSTFNICIDVHVCFKNSLGLCLIKTNLYFMQVINELFVSLTAQKYFRDLFLFLYILTDWYLHFWAHFKSYMPVYWDTSIQQLHCLCSYMQFFLLLTRSHFGKKVKKMIVSNEVFCSCDFFLIRNFSLYFCRMVMAIRMKEEVIPAQVIIVLPLTLIRQSFSYK